MDYDVNSIAKLAHINLSSERNMMLNQDFGNILDYVNTLTSLDLESQTIPTYYIQSLREDIAFDNNPIFSDNIKENIIKEMPLVEDGYLVVKSVLKK
ncbi:MAG: Asp-tRNA(Asn)/Glu-tRNA(Gln) amidotransferase subunit GatC [Minisyncoccia bacterium]